MRFHAFQRCFRQKSLSTHAELASANRAWSLIKEAFVRNYAARSNQVYARAGLQAPIFQQTARLFDGMCFKRIAAVSGLMSVMSESIHQHSDTTRAPSIEILC